MCQYWLTHIHAHASIQPCTAYTYIETHANIEEKDYVVIK
jgi:hypothetical protein